MAGLQARLSKIERAMEEGRAEITSNPLAEMSWEQIVEYMVLRFGQERANKILSDMGRDSHGFRVEA